MAFSFLLLNSRKQNRKTVPASIAAPITGGTAAICGIVRMPSKPPQTSRKLPTIISTIQICYTKIHGGRIISVRLLRSPVSSDCAFNRMGCSVSSRYTFPSGLGSAFSAGTVYHAMLNLTIHLPLSLKNPAFRIT